VYRIEQYTFLFIYRGRTIAIINTGRFAGGAQMRGSAARTFIRLRRASLVPIPFPKPLLLCVEDDPIYLDLRKAVLENEGYSVIGVTSVDEALQTLREAPVRCTIADHMLKGQTGIDAAKEMKKIKPNVPIILYSGTNPETIQHVDVFINKGEPTATFLQIVRDVVQR
jgi:CheY-like chemotaxis protein